MSELRMEIMGTAIYVKYNGWGYRRLVFEFEDNPTWYIYNDDDNRWDEVDDEDLFRTLEDEFHNN